MCGDIKVKKKTIQSQYQQEYIVKYYRLLLEHPMPIIYKALLHLAWPAVQKKHYDKEN